MTKQLLTRLDELHKKGHWTHEELYEMDLLYKKFYEYFRHFDFGSAGTINEIKEDMVGGKYNNKSPVDKIFVLK